MPALFVDPSLEEASRARLREHYAPAYAERVDGYVSALLEPDNHVERLRDLLTTAGPHPDLGAPLMISGFSAGSEVVAAKRLGFERIWGVEVDSFLHKVAEARLGHIPEVNLTVYDGGRLPYDDESFGFVTSSHIVEHTADPALYLSECMRVLRVGGYFSLEFPTRYHTRELHTGLPSLEWSPRLVRDAALRALASRWSPARDEVKTKCRAIVGTRLQQISFGWVRRAVRRAGYSFTVAAFARPAPGVVRAAIRRGRAG